MSSFISSGGKLIIPYKLGGSAQGQDQYLVYEFMKRLLIPYDQWEAYSTGVIDKNGNVLVSKGKRTPRQARSFGQFDNLMIKLRELVKTAPTARNKLLPATAALYLLREYKEGGHSEEIDMVSFVEIYERLCESQVPTNVVGSGAIAGANGDPPGPTRRKRYKIMKRKKPN